MQLATGDVVYDEFDDSFLRSEFETRLSHIHPSEIIIPESLSGPTEKILNHFTGVG